MSENEIGINELSRKLQSVTDLIRNSNQRVESSMIGDLTYKDTIMSISFLDWFQDPLGGKRASIKYTFKMDRHKNLTGKAYYIHESSPKVFLYQENKEEISEKRGYKFVDQLEELYARLYSQNW